MNLKRLRKVAAKDEQNRQTPETIERWEMSFGTFLVVHFDDAREPVNSQMIATSPAIAEKTKTGIGVRYQQALPPPILRLAPVIRQEGMFVRAKIPIWMEAGCGVLFIK